MRVHRNCCGLDVHKETIAACLISESEDGTSSRQKRIFGTMTQQLRELAQWLAEAKVTAVAMEATGIYWVPVWNVLEPYGFELLLINPEHYKAVRGKKTDLKDGERIAELLQDGRLAGSYVPPVAIRVLRDLTRYRTKLVQYQSSIANRIQRLLEQCNVKLASVASDVLGVSGQAMLRALAAGETNPQRMADLAKKQLRKKIPALQLALEGCLLPHHRFLLSDMLEELDHIGSKIARVEQAIAEQMRPYQKAVDAWMTVPGVKQRLAWNLVAEVGPTVDAFPSAADLVSWAGICPGNNETAGKRKSGTTRNGNRWARKALCEAAWAASKTKATYLQAQFRRLAAIRGSKRAIIAVASTILTIGYHMLKQGTTYRELGGNYFDKRNLLRTTRRLVKRLQALGHTVILEPRQSPFQSSD
jgi:transposase